MLSTEICEATARCRIRLSDALVRIQQDGSDESGEPVREARTPDTGIKRGFRYQRCGGGRRVIRRQRRVGD